MIRMARSAFFVVLVLAASVVEARAQMSMGSFYGYLTGHIGANVGGDAADPRVNGGASMSVQETTGWGAEFDFGRATDLNVGNQTLDINTYMVNMAYIRPSKGIRPFAIAGAGIQQVSGCVCSTPAASKTYDLALNGGGGIFLMANDAIGMRADARYIWSAADRPELGRPDHLKYWRLTVGVTYLWTIAP